MKWQRKYSSLLAAFLLFWGGNILAQANLDSIIGATTIKIYENPNAAITTGSQVLEKAETAKTKVNALMLISNAYLSKRENGKSLEFALKARDYLPEIASVKYKINVLNTIGMQHQQLRIYDKAIEYLDEALALAEKLEHKDSLHSLLGYNYAARGFIYREQMSCDIALNYFDKSIAEYRKGNTGMATANLSTLHYNKGNCFLQISKIDSARANFEKSIHYSQIIDAKSLNSFAKKGLSEVYTVEGNYMQAIEILKEAENASDSVGDLVLNQGIYKNLSDNYLATSNRELYKKYFKKFTDVQKQIAEKEQKTINNSIENLIAENNSKTQLAVSKLKNIQWILVVSAVVLLFIIVYFINGNFKKCRIARKNVEASMK